MPNQNPPFFVVAEGARLLGPFPHRYAAEQIALDLSCGEGTESAILSAAELAILRDRLAMMELRS